MATKKNRKTIYIIASIVIALFIFGGNSMKKESRLETPMEITFHTRSGSQTQAIVDGQDYPDAIGQFGVSVTNQKTIPIENITYVDHWDDAVGGGPMETTAAFPWVTIDLNPSQTSSVVYTDWFDLEWYATNNPGDNTFYFRFNYDYVNALGVPVEDNIITGSIIVNILPSGTQDFVDFRTGLNTYDYVSSCGGGSSSGTRWIAYSNTCGQELTGYGYVSSVSSTTFSCEEEATQESWVYIMDAPYYPVGGCALRDGGDGRARLYDISADRGPGYLAVCETDLDGIGYKYRYYRDSDPDASDAVTSQQIIDSNNENNCSGTTCSCEWQDDDCGPAGGCASTAMHQTYECDPALCEPWDEQCVADHPTCLGCSCDAWVDNECGGGTCPANEMHQLRNCTPDLCLAEEQCVTDASCETTSYVNFRRTTTSICDIGSGDAIAYTDTCTNTLIGYGYEYLGSSGSIECDERPQFDNCLATPLGTVSCVILDNLPFPPTTCGSYDLEVFKLYQDDTYPEQLWVCADDSDGTGSVAVRYDTDDCDGPGGEGECGYGDCATLSCSEESSDPTYEVGCP